MLCGYEGLIWCFFFFFKQKTAYEMLRSLVGSEMCIRDSAVDVAAMVKAGLMRRAKGGVKLLGDGELKSKVDFAVYRASESAVAAVKKVGGSVKILAPAKEVDAEPKGKNKRMALEAAKGPKPKAAKPKTEAVSYTH